MNEQRDGFSCIVPFYNEGKTVVGVVSALLKVKEISQIVCVDDGSTDGVSATIKTKFPDVDLVVLEKNGGKTHAIASGLKRVKCNNILMMDGDLKKIKPREISDAIAAYKNNKELDMLIMRNLGPNMIDILIRVDIFLSGKRILKKKDLLKILKERPEGYQIEVAINNYMMENGKKVGWVKNSAFNPHKVGKFGLIKGMTKDFKMGYSMIAYTGPIGYLKQILLFCWKEIKA